MSGHVHRRGSYSDGRPRWIARYRGPDRKERQRAFRRQSDARAWLRERQSDIGGGAWVPPERAKRHFADVADEWLTLHTGKPSTTAGYRSVLRSHINPRFGNREIGSIERPEIRRLVADLSSTGLSANTVRNALNVVKGVCSHGVEAGALRSSPAAGVAAPRGCRREMTVATTEQVAEIAENVPLDHGTLILTAAYTGLRAGELFALRVGDLDLMRGRVHVRRAVAEVRGELVTGVPKSGRERTVSLPPFLRELLASHVMDVATDPEALVFRSRSGAQLRISNFYPRIFRPAADQAGLPELRFHDLRHTCVAFLIESGAHPRAIMERLGHSSVAVTLDTYGHTLPSLDDDLTVALESRYRAAG